VLRSGYEILVRDVGYLVDFDCNLFGAECCFGIGAEVDDFVDALGCPEALVFAGDWHGEAGGPSEDVDGLGGEDLLDELHVALDECIGVVDVGVDLPDRSVGAVGVGQGEGVHEDVVELVEDGFGEGAGPSGIDGLQADADRVLA